MSQYLEIWDLNKTYDTPKGPAVIVRDFTLSLKQGEFVAIIGHSGCGKSTVLSIVAGLTKKTSGSMTLANKELIGAGPDRGVVFQAPCLLPWLTALGNVMLGVDQVATDKTREQREAVAKHYLTVVGLGHAMHKYPAELSGGMRQRVGIARAFALNPKMLLLDEPFGMLNALTKFELQQVLIDLWSEDQKTALMVTHDVDEAIFLADRVVMMTSGPAATIGEIVDIPFPRPRNRAALLEDPQFYEIRERLIAFLESQDHRKPQAETLPAAETELADAIETEEVATV
ncbi:MAG: ABC transporter ATP-binding protein [Tepidisphaeraceae bacterium]